MVLAVRNFKLARKFPVIWYTLHVHVHVVWYTVSCLKFLTCTYIYFSILPSSVSWLLTLLYFFPFLDCLHHMFYHSLLLCSIPSSLHGSSCWLCACLGDRMGCGVDFGTDSGTNQVRVFFTKNGQLIKEPRKMRRPLHGLYPLIG